MPFLKDAIRNRSKTMVFALTATVILLFACGGGGGGQSSPPKDSVTITGAVDAGSGNAPISNARCRFVDTNGTEHDTDQSDSNGTYHLYVPPGIRGYILVNPQSVPSLTLSTASSTIGLGAGSIKASENITPTTTVIADLINSENPSDPEMRKVELLSAIYNQQDPNLAIVAAIATRLYGQMLSRGINSQFGAPLGGSDGGGGPSDSDVEGEAGDGADFSPLVDATCEFVYGDTLSEGETCYPAALGDLFNDGILNRPDLVNLAANVTAGYDAQTLIQAFANVFPNGIGKPIATQTGADGSYRLPTPPGVTGFVRCSPKNRANLILGTYVPARQAGVTLEDQDVNPATTVFSAIIAPKLTAADVTAAKDNFLQDIAGLDIQVQIGTSGEVEDFQLRPGTEPDNEGVGLVAFSATALFNAFNKNGLDIDFLAALDDLVDNAVETPSNPVDPAFLQNQGLTASQSQSVASVVNNSIENTSQQLETDLDVALSTGRLHVIVQDESGHPIQGALVEIENQIDCSGCGATTSGDGSLELVLSGLNEAATDIVVIASGVPGYLESRQHVSIVAFATVDAVVRMNSESNNSVTGASGNPVSLDGTWEGICNPDLEDGESNESSITISGTSFSLTEHHWLDSTNCSGSYDAIQEIRGTFALGDELTVAINSSSVTATQLDVTINTATGTVINPSFIDEMNQDRECGYDDWAVDVSKDLLGTSCDPDQSSRDVIYVDDTGDRDIFYNGDDDMALDSSGYPTVIDLESAAERQ
jgi:hypothetical protein